MIVNIYWSSPRNRKNVVDWKKMKQDRARRPDLFLVQLHKRTRVSSQAYL